MNRSFSLSFGSLLVASFLGTAAVTGPVRAEGALPGRLQDTGFRFASDESAPDALQRFTPQYPLWSDGTDKRRWIHLPPGTTIDASNPDAWVFPRGTKLWKEFALHGRRLETRYIEHQADGTWRFAAYVWNESGTEAVLAPSRGTVIIGVAGSPRGRYLVPSRGDCMVCHGSTTVPVLGFTALQLSTDRDPNAAGARAPRKGELDLRALLAHGTLRNWPGTLSDAPRIPAASPIERAALGTLHGNCAHCHNTSANRAPLNLTLAHGVAEPVDRYREVLRTTIGAPSRWRASHADDDAGAALEPHVIVPGLPESSVLFTRMQSRHGATQMPPLATELPDRESLELIHHWITHDLTQPHKELRP